MIPLIQPGSGKVLRVAEGSADFWRSLGYSDPTPAPVEEPKSESKPARKRAAKKAAEKPSDD